MVYELLYFLKNPVSVKNHEGTGSQLLKGIIEILIIKILTTIPVFIIIGKLKGMGIVPKITHAGMSTLIKSNDLLTILIMSFQLLILAPIVEELAFRGILRFNKVNFIISASLSISFVFTKLTYIYEPLSNYFGLMSFSVAVAAVALIISPFFLYIAQHFNDEIIHQYQTKKLSITLWISCTLFALVHINSNMNQLVVWVIPILILPQFISGFYFSFTRLKYGLKGSILLHVLANALVWSAAMFKSSFV